MRPLTQRTNKEIVADIVSLADILGMFEFERYEKMFQKERNNYHIKDYYEAFIKYVEWQENTKYGNIRS